MKCSGKMIPNLSYFGIQKPHLGFIFSLQWECPRTYRADHKNNHTQIFFQIHLLWHQSKASGFITIRPYSEAFEDSNLSIIDTVYIRKSARGHGFLSKFLAAKLNNDDSNELGFSDPISNSMLIVLMKLLKKNPNQRERIWLVNEENGERQILWWSAMKIARQRNIDLKSILKWTLNWGGFPYELILDWDVKLKQVWT